MDKEIMQRLTAALDADEIYRSYADSLAELEPEYQRIAQSLPEDQRRILTGVWECGKLLELRTRTLVCQNMTFAEEK